MGDSTWSLCSGRRGSGTLCSIRFSATMYTASILIHSGAYHPHTIPTAVAIATATHP